MDLSPEQKQSVAKWVAAGDSLSAIQQKLNSEFKISMTYMDVRFLVDDLNLELKDAKPKRDPAAEAKVAAQQEAPAQGKAPAKKGFLDKMKEKVGLGEETEAEDELEAETEEAIEDDLADGTSSLSVTVDQVTLIPGALASGSVTFSDGVTGKWIVDQYGRPGFTEISKPGYRPKPADAQAFMQELSAKLQRQAGY